MALGGAMLVILGLTFALGLLMGRQWARQTASPQTGRTMTPVSERARKPAAPPRRSGIAAETTADRTPESTEKLTFYHTLTEPMEGPPVPLKPETKPVAVKIPAAPPAPAPPPSVKTPHPTPPAPSLPARKTPKGTRKTPKGKTADGGSAGVISRPPQLNNGGSAGAISRPPQLNNPWTIQVGAYRNRRQADDSRQHLVAAGLDAYVVTQAAREGQARYRVRVGTYRTREEAAAAAERLRAQRSLATFVTPK
ncbi:MAG: SPOR domain-containing protein [Candidatus Rokuibacteriota bacterium]